ncbi:MAG: sulfatase [Eubacteriales bacterium]|nr:sulfatase [Eubacteriales bacterium]MDD3866853.1 sulfatase [Eubacteriales bacterium]MDD4461259.1 sulfatase [Eubacteriales bacterium]
MRILMLDIDTLRPDHMSCYGYPRRTTPRMDAIAAQGTRFDQYYCSDAPCLPSRASLISGRFGIHHGAVGHGGTAADRRLSGGPRDFRDWQDLENFHHLFRKAGLYTASISTFAERHSSHWFTAGFNEVHNVGGGGMESGEEVLPVALDWLDREKDREDWFLHVHFWDPHTPYRAPEAFGNPFADEPLPDWLTDPAVLERHMAMTGPHTALDVSMYDDKESPQYPRQPGKVTDMAGMRRIIDGYDCGIRYADQLIGQIFDRLADQGILDDVAVIITADHGENFGELGIYAEHATADPATCRIPLIIRWPGLPGGQTDQALHYNIDLVPTVADLLNLSHAASWDGRSFASTLQDGRADGRSHLVLSQMAHVCQRSVLFGDWLYMRTWHDGYHLFPSEMLYHLSGDPHEQTDVADRYPERCAEGARLLENWHADMMENAGSTVDPLWVVLEEGGPYHARGHLEDYLVRLEATGRHEGAAALRERWLKNG